MPTTTEALAIAVLFLAPGLLYEWALELSAGYRRPESPHKALQAFTRSVFAQIVLSPLVLLAWREHRQTDFGRAPLGTLAIVGLALLGYVALPVAVGLLVGWRQRRTGGATPSAWDALFEKKELRGFVRAKLRGGSWVGGVYVRIRGGDPAEQGFASGYPDPESLFLPLQVVLDPETGDIVMGEDGPQLRDWGVLLRGQDIEMLEFQPFDIDGKAP